MKTLIPILALSILIASCNNQKDNMVSDSFSEDAEIGTAPMVRQASKASPVSTQDLKQPEEVIKKKIIKDGRLGLQVNDLEKTKMHIDTLLKSYNGYYANERFNNTDWETSYSLNIRIPAENFENFISGIESGDGEILYKEVDARDVTDQFIDLETRLENKRNYLKRYNDLLRQAKSVKEILEIEEKIRGLEEEIESTTGRLKYLGDLVDYSTLDLNISKKKDFKYNPVKRDNFFERLKQSLSKGWFGFVDFSLFIIRLWPFWILVVIIVCLWKRYRRKRRNKK